MKHPIPAEALKRHMAILGMTGSGKSSTGRRVVEEVVEQGHRVCILDTIKSDWWGITSSRSGKSPGLPFKILGGPRGHLALHSSAGKAIGQLVGSGKLPLSIIDMADFEPGGLQRFFVDFVPALMRSMKGVVYLVIEEAHEVAPKERAGFGAENMAIHFAKKLGTGGRTKGIRLIVLTQRVQALHNAVLGSCETVIAHRIGFADDQVPVLKWMKAKIGKDNAAVVEAELANLPDGVGFIASGAPVKIFERVKFPLFATYDNTATPEHDAAQLDIKTAPVDPEELRAIIGDAVKEAEANDPAKLKAQIATLTADKARLERQAQAAAAVPAPPDSQAIVNAEKWRFKRGFDEAVNQASSYASLVKTHVDEAYRAIGAMADTVSAIGQIELKFVVAQDDIPSGSPAPQGLHLSPAKLTTPMREAVRAAPRMPTPAASGDGSNSSAMTKALTAMVELASLGVDAPKREMIAAMANYTNIQSRPIREAFAQMLSFGWATGDAGRLSLTEIGRSQVLVPPAPLNTDDMRDRIARAIGSAAGKVLDELIAAHPESRPREYLATVCGYSNIQSRPIREAFSKLIDMGFVTSQGGSLRAGEALFP